MCFQFTSAIFSQFQRTWGLQEEVIYTLGIKNEKLNAKLLTCFLSGSRDKNPRRLEIVRSGLFSIVPSVVRVTDIFPGLNT